MSGVLNLPCMAKKSTKPTGGKHQKKRTGVNFPEEWMALLNEQAVRLQKPKMWYLVSLMQQDLMKSHGMKEEQFPIPPWHPDAKKRKKT